MSSLARLRDRPLRLPFLLFLSARMNIWRHRTMALLTVFAVVASAALATGLEIASRSVRTEMRSSAEAIIGDAQLEVVASKRGIPEQLVEQVASVPGVFAASPLISETFRLAGPVLSSLPLHVLGIDLLAEHKVRDYEVTRNRVKIRDPLLLLGNQNSIILTELLAQRLGLKEHDSFRVRAPNGEHNLVLEGLLAEGGLADAFAGQIAVMDVWSLQLILGAEGWIDKIEITLEADADVEQIMARIDERIGGVAVVRRPSSQQHRFGSVMRMLDFAGGGINLLGIVIASLLAYAALAHVVDSRSQEFALMQCVGLDARGVRLLIALDALVLSAIGAGLGAMGGILLAPPLLDGFSRFSEHFQSVKVDEMSLAPSTFAAAALVWLVVAFLAGLPPSRRAARQHPLEILSSTRIPSTAPEVRRAYVTVSAGALVSLIVIWLNPLGLPAGIRLGGVFAIGLGAMMVTSGHITLEVVQRIRPWLSAIPRVGALIGTSTLARPAAASVCLGAIAAVVFALTLILTALHSLTSSIGRSMAETYQDGASVRAGSPTGMDREVILPHTIEKIRATAGVEDVAIFYNLYPSYKGEPILLGAISAATLLRRGGFHPNDGPAAELAAALGRGEIAISHAFQHRFGVDVGDSITLETRIGPEDFRVGGFYRDYSGPGGSLHLDVDTFDRYFLREGAHFLALWASVPLPQVRDEVIRRTAGGQTLFFTYGEKLKAAADSALGRFRDLLNLLAGVSAFFSAVALLTLLTGAVAARRRDLALMQVIGATPGNIAAVVLLDGALVALIGAVGGALLGLVGGEIVTDLFFERFGWVIDYEVEVGPVLMTVLATVAIALAVGCLPAWLARRARPMSVLSFE